jgi:type IV pilus assembly protein PilW
MVIKMKVKEAALCRQQRGFSLIEIMVALVIGILASYAIYFVYGNAERTKRNVVSVGEAQTSGFYSVFLINHLFANSGGGALSAATALRNCPGGPGVGEINGSGNTTTLRPIPVAIDVDSFGNNRIFVSYGTSSLYPVPLNVDVASDLAANSMIINNAPLGFRPNSVLYAIGSDPGGGNDFCQAIQINNSVNSVTGLVGVIDSDGAATVTFNGTLPTGKVVNQVVDMGNPERLIISLVGDVLQVQKWSIPATGGSAGVFVGGVPEPIVSNVMRFYAQYGLDTDGDGRVDTWQATDAAWSWAGITGVPPATIGRIKAVRFGLVVRADEPDREYEQDFDVTLFGACPPGTVSCTNVSIPVHIANPDSAGLRWRYRAYETVVPVRNSIWNPNAGLV